MATTILMIEDNPDILKINRELFSPQGYRVLEAMTLNQAVDILQAHQVDLVLLDVMMPDGSGFDFCEHIRSHSAVPILFLTALGENQHIIDGLIRGGDDYLPKPYDLDVLSARVQALLRRAKLADGEKLSVQVGPLQLQINHNRAYLAGQDIGLTHTEFVILEYLARHADRYISADELYENLWRMNDMGDVRTVWVHISRIRKKFGEDAPVDIESLRGQGYRLVLIDAAS